MAVHPRSTVLNADVAVIGGGVAGSALAAALSQVGLGVVLVEREARFRDRVRGEGIHPWGVKQLAALGLLDVVREAGAQALTITAVYAERAQVVESRWESYDPGSPGEWAIYHPTLQTALLARAAQCGVRVLRPARVIGFTRETAVRLDVVAGDGDYEVHARLVVGADGRQSSARQWIGATTMADPTHHLVGGCLLDNVALADDTFHTGSLDGAGVLVFPQGGGRARTYMIGSEQVIAPFRGREQVSAFIDHCAGIFPAGAFADACALGPLGIFPNADTWSDRLSGDRVVLIGDAAGANDPSQGHGLSLCFKDARELRDQLLAEPDWDIAIDSYATRRAMYYQVLRHYAQWRAILAIDTGAEADALRAGMARAAEHDPDLGGFTGPRLLSHGPAGLVADEAARRHYFGEDLV